MPELEAHFRGPKHGGGGAIHGIDADDADVIDAILARARGTWSRVDRSKLRQSHEAWIHVLLTGDDQGLLEGLGPYPRPAVLTWPNSD